jgi:hypothetical protein
MQDCLCASFGGAVALGTDHTGLLLLLLGEAVVGSKDSRSEPESTCEPTSTDRPDGGSSQHEGVIEPPSLERHILSVSQVLRSTDASIALLGM